MNNPLYRPIKELLGTLNLLYGLIFILENRFANYRKQTINDNVDLSKLFAGSSLAIRKLSEWPKDGYARYYPSGKFFVSGKNYLETLGQLIQRESAWTVAQGYERFESFLFGISAIFLVNNNGYAEKEKKKIIEKCKNKLKLSNFQLNNVQNWRLVLKKCYSNKDILKSIRKWVPNFENVVEKNNNRMINLIDWYRVVTEVRHATIHSNLIIKNKVLQKTLRSRERKALLKKYFTGEQSITGYKLTLCKEKAMLNLCIFAEYALEIFNNLSDKANYDY